MKAVRFHAFGDASVLHYEDLAVPVPGADQVRIRVAATSFNPVDAGIRGGFLQQAFPVTLPHIPGIDVAGTIEALGADVTGHHVGERVIAYLPMLADGAAAEFVLAPAESLAAAPASIPLADAAALPVVGLTAWQALFEHADLRAGQRLLVNGAGGAVGGYVIQLASHAGAHVIATASPRSLARVRAAGADEVIDHTARNVVADALDQPVDIVLNLAPIPPAELSALAHVVAVGGSSHSSGGGRAGGVVLTTVPTAMPAEAIDGLRVAPIFVRNDAGQLAALAARVDAGELHVEVAERVPLAELAAVHARADAGALSGKVIVVPA